MQEVINKISPKNDIKLLVHRECDYASHAVIITLRGGDKTCDILMNGKELLSYSGQRLNLALFELKGFMTDNGNDEYFVIRALATPGASRNYASFVNLLSFPKTVVLKGSDIPSLVSALMHRVFE